MIKEIRSTPLRYALALGLFAVTLGIASLLAFLTIKVNLTILIVAALVATAWYGGRGPGFLLSILLILTTIAFSPLPAGTTRAQAAFSHLSVFLLLVVLVLLVSGRRKTESRLREQSELLQVTLSSIGDAVIATDLNGAITFVNPTAEILTGWTHAEASGKPLEKVLQIINENTREPIESPFRKVKEQGIMVGLADTVLICKDGKEVPINDSGAPIKDKEGNVIGTIIVFHDISQRRSAEQALLKSEERLVQSQKMEAIGVLTGGVAHDFNNLLTAILGHTQLALRKIKPDDPLQLSLIEVEKAGNRAAVLTRQLLVFSRRQHLERRNMDLNETIAEIFKLIERIIGEDIKVSIKYAEDLSTVFADRGQIEQVIMNLSVNARDAMPQGGSLSIETSSIELDEYYCRQYPDFVPGKYVLLTVSDGGCGMDEETQARIFEPFFTTKDVHKGTGLGLSMVYGIVKQHDGYINVYSELGHGTTFKVFLPANEVEVEAEKAEIEPSLHGGQETVLVAEDEEALRNLSRDILESLGYRVLMAENGLEAVEIFKANRSRINILIFDVVMPSMGGTEAYERICEAGGDVPVVFMTGYSSEIVYERISQRSAGDPTAVKMIQKPYSFDGLGRAVREALDSVVNV